MKREPGNLLIWGFGNHEPIDMYRRCGISTTGGVPGNARWLKKWHNFYDSDESVALLQDMGVNILHCRFYKGMGWEHEQHDFPAVREFALRCRKRGIKVIAYVQHATLYWELMQKEIPHLRAWAIIGANGKPAIYAGKEYWRWAPCPNNPEYRDYICKILQIAMDAGCFDGVLFDNVGNYPCYCPRCQQKFREYVKTHYDFDFLDPDYIELPPMPAIDSEVQDPLQQAMLSFRQETLTEQYRQFRDYIKSRQPDFILSGNYPLVTMQYSAFNLGGDMVELSKVFDLIMSQSSNLVKVADGCVISQVPELKFARAAGIPDLPLTDGCAATLDLAEEFLIARFCESLFGGGILVERSAMRPKRGGEPDMAVIAHRKQILNRIKAWHREYKALLDMPHYEPIGVLFSKESVYKSYDSVENTVKVQESLMRNHLPFRCVIADANGIKMENLAGCTTLIVPGAKLLSDKVVTQLQNFAGRLIVIGDECGDYDENYAQRAENPFAGAEKISMPEHQVRLARFRTEIQYVKDDWRQYFPDMPEVELNAESVVDFKCDDDGVITGVLISSPVVSGGGTVALPEGEWFVEPFGEIKRPAEYKDGKVVIPTFRGGCIICCE